MKRVAVVAGGSDGIGKQTVIELLSAGYSVAFIGKTETKVLSLQKELQNTDCKGYCCDATKENDVVKVFADIIVDFGRIDVLVNSVGGSLGKAEPIDEMQLCDWNKIIELNLTGMFLCTREAVKVMKKSNYGRIVNISSLAGRSRSVLGGVAYSTSKAGILGFTRQCSKDLAPFGISVTAVAPGTVLSGERIECYWNSKPESQRQDFLKSNPCGRLGTNHDIARTIVFLCSEDSFYLNGAVIDINGGTWVG